MFYEYQTVEQYENTEEPKESTRFHPNKAKRGELYEMFNKSEKKSYVGYTINSTKQRFQEHKEFEKDPMHKHGKLIDWQVKKLFDVF